MLVVFTFTCLLCAYGADCFIDNNRLMSGINKVILSYLILSYAGEIFDTAETDFFQICSFMIGKIFLMLCYSMLCPGSSTRIVLEAKPFVSEINLSLE